MCMRYVYSFNEGSKEMKSLLGGKGANLAEMTKIGLPVPPGFTITTKACNDYYENNKTIKQEIIDQIEEKLSILEKDLTPQSLNDAVFKLLGDKELLIDMANNAKKIGKPEAIDLIYNEIMKSYNEAVGSKNKKEKQAESKENILEEQVSKEPKVIGIKKK